MKSPVIKYSNASGIIYEGQVWLLGFTVAGDAAGADAQIYDGLNTSGTQICHIEALTATTENLDLRFPILLQKGIYLAVNATTTKCTIIYVPADKGDLSRFPL